MIRSSVIADLVKVRDHMGWNPAHMDRLPTRMMCVIAELDEFERELEAIYMTEGHVNAAEELADVAMYLLCTLHDLWSERWSCRPLGVHPTPYQASGEITKPVRRRMARAFDAWRKVANPNRLADVCINLEFALAEVEKIAVALDINLEASIEAKIKVLYTRGPTNGGKHPDS